MDKEVSQDMHLKMSKKIAQLTKVIYALNTKNDEHEAIVAAMKEQHDKEKQQIYDEMQKRLNRLNELVSDRSKLHNKIDQLQDALMFHIEEKEKLGKTWEAQQRTAELQVKQAEEGHAERLSTLATELLAVRQKLQTQLHVVDQLKMDASETLMEQLQAAKTQHAAELEQLKNELHDNNKNSVAEIEAKLIEKHQAEVAKLEAKLKLSIEEKQQMEAEWEAKVAKLQALHEKEMKVLEESAKSSGEVVSLRAEVTSLRDEVDRLTKELRKLEQSHKKRDEELLTQIADLELALERKEKELNDLLKQHKNSSGDLEAELAEARRAADKSLTKLKETEAELAASRERCEDQADQLVRNANQLGGLETQTDQQRQHIQELEHELGGLRDRLAWMEQERRGLEDRSSSQQQKQGERLKSLETSLESLSAEKRKMQQEYEEKITKLKKKNKEEKERHLREIKDELDSLRKKLNEEFELRRKQMIEEFNSEKERLINELKEKLRLAEESREQLEISARDSREELVKKLKLAEGELDRVREQVNSSEQGLGSAEQQINSLKQQIERLELQVDKSEARVTEANTRADRIKSELEQQRLSYEQKIQDNEKETKQKLDQLSRDLDVKWTQTLRKECEALRLELSRVAEEDKRAALDRLSAMKDEELVLIRKEMEAQLDRLRIKIRELEAQLTGSSEASASEIKLLQQKHDELVQSHQSEIDRINSENQQRLDELEREHQRQQRELEERVREELQEEMSTLRTKHHEDMKATQLAHQTTLETTRDAAERQLKKELDQLAAVHQTELERQKIKLESELNVNSERMRQEHQQQLAAARMELQRAIEVAKRKDAENENRLDAVKGELTSRDRLVRNLEQEVTALQVSLDELRADLEAKGREVLQIRADANAHIKKREEMMRQQNRDVIDQMKKEQAREMQSMIKEFNSAQLMLKEKITELKQLLAEAEEKYENRESRDEDLETIRRLRETLADREHEIKRLVDEKKYFQMELVNRETNFNKMFNTAPNVGQLNPLGFNTKPKQKTSSAGSSKGPPGGRLDPLPNSPGLHDSQINPTRPLPPPSNPTRGRVLR